MELCKNCHAGCCRRYNPSILGIDIIRICKALNVDMFFLISAIKIDEEKAEKLKNEKPIFIFTDLGEKMYFSLILKSNLSRLYPETTKCIFLQEWSAEAQQSEELTGIIGRCGIYDIRPLNCRKWPAEYDDEEHKVVIPDPYTVLEKTHEKANDSPAYSLCPEPIKPEYLTKYEEMYNKYSVLYHKEKAFFIKVAQKWNEKPDLSDNFYKFLLKEYASRIPHIKT